MTETRKAKVISRPGSFTPNGRERVWELRAGANGKGRLIHSVVFWPWSGGSVEAAEYSINAAAHRAGYEIVSDEVWA